jgi:hypothetical protein
MRKRAQPSVASTRHNSFNVHVGFAFACSRSFGCGLSLSCSVRISVLRAQRSFQVCPKLCLALKCNLNAHAAQTHDVLCQRGCPPAGDEPYTDRRHPLGLDWTALPSAGSLLAPSFVLVSCEARYTQQAYQEMHWRVILMFVVFAVLLLAFSYLPAVSGIRFAFTR